MHTGSLRSRNWPNSKLIMLFLKSRTCALCIWIQIAVGFQWKLINYTQCKDKKRNICFFVFTLGYNCKKFPLNAPSKFNSSESAHGGLFEGNISILNWPNSKLICYSERGEPRLPFEYKFVGHSWKLLKLYPSVHSYFFFCLYTVLYCFHWEHQQVEGVQSAHGGSLRYEGIGQIQNWYVILKEENVGFHLNINLSAILENFLNYTPVYINISFFVFTLYCIVSTESTSKLKECKVHTEAL